MSKESDIARIKEKIKGLQSQIQEQEREQTISVDALGKMYTELSNLKYELKELLND